MKKYWDLVYAVAVAFTGVIIVAALLLFAHNGQAAAITAGLGTAASGGGVAFILKQRRHYEKALATALVKIEEFCGEDVRLAME